MKKTVFVGLSGGVDSSVAARRLIDEGYSVVGVFIKVWQPDFLECNWEKERLDAMRVAAHLNIPFLMLDAEEAYKHEVAEYFINEYRIGRTPNPDVLCNKEIKFGVFLSFAKEHGADYIATGHYAQVQEVSGTHTLLRGADMNKDQSYFLWTLTQEQLAHVLLPVGKSRKAQIREEAQRARIPVAEKSDSQGICFLGHVDMQEFLSHYIELSKGDVLNEHGDIIGTHEGAVLYTKGQRHGFEIHTASESREPYYVYKRNIERNTITVTTQSPMHTTQEAIELSNVHWISTIPKAESTYTAQFRYRQKPCKVTVSNIAHDTCTVTPLEEVDEPAAGQSCVLYRDDVCLGGGIIA